MVFGYSSYEFFLYSRMKTTALLLLERFLPSQRPEQKDLTGKTALVIGANVGIGLEISRGLASRGATVVLGCRNRDKAEAAKKDIEGSLKGNIRSDQIEVMVVNVSDLNSVRAMVQEWGSRPLDILLNNAGITTATFSKGPQGFENTYTTNILSHYLLTLLLLPHIRPNGRIINTSSGSNYDSDAIDPLDLDYSKQIEAKGMKDGDLFVPANLTMLIYGRTKLLQIFFTRELQHRLEQSDVYKSKGITVHSYHPGLVRSAIWQREGNMTVSNMARNIIMTVVNTFGISTTEGAATAIYLAVSDAAVKKPGLYWHRMRVSGPNRFIENAENRKVVFDQMAVEADLEESFKL
ncbi:hypothetical protein DL96DRAFT_1552914 [Flagelloscypha sp. PMI_526]|nr:hypothetical protein DL96DRAFT_1552914 [Flagelloscypha sp. PMI_526]